MNMKMHLWLAALGVVFHSLTPKFALARDLKITCMEKIQGVPSEPVVYTFHEETGELLSSSYSEGPLSSFKEVLLGHTTSDLGASTSYSSHQWIKNGEILKRSVNHIPDKGSKERPWTFVQIYDFKKQRVFDGNNKIDSCHHSLYKMN